MTPVFREGDNSAVNAATRTAWVDGFPAVIIHTTVADRDRHPGYAKAKSGDLDGALSLAQDLVAWESCDVLLR